MKLNNFIFGSRVCILAAKNLCSVGLRGEVIFETACKKGLILKTKNGCKRVYDCIIVNLDTKQVVNVSQRYINFSNILPISTYG